jgi:apolipoprotein N-acyltransferase
VPFGEWIPFRDQLLPLIPLLQQVGAQSVPGTRPGVLDVSASGRPIKVGDVICFELAYDQTIYSALRDGAQVMMVQSNNATYGGTGQIEQQFAITRARAMESRREIAVATTNSVSGFITRDGSVAIRTQEFTAQSMVVEMPLRSALTPAIIFAPWLERGLALVAVLACLVALVAGTRQVRMAKPERRAGDTNKKEISVEPTTAPYGPTADGRGAVRLRSPGTDSGDHSDLQRVGEHRTDHQPDP